MPRAIFICMRFRKAPPAPTITFDKLLTRRGYTFESWLNATGASSYAEVVRWCNNVGCIPPSEDSFKVLRPEPVNAPMDGIVVVPPLALEPLTLDDSGSNSGNPANNPVQSEVPTVTQRRRRVTEK